RRRKERGVSRIGSMRGRLRSDGAADADLLARPVGGGAAEEAAEVARHLRLVEIACIERDGEPVPGVGRGSAAENLAEAEDGLQRLGRNADMTQEQPLQAAALGGIARRGRKSGLEAAHVVAHFAIERPAALLQRGGDMALHEIEAVRKLETLADRNAAI